MTHADKPNPMKASDKSNYEARFKQAIALHEAGRLEEALQCYRKLAESFPRHPQLLTHYGVASLQMGQSNEGMELLRKSLRIEPRQPMALANLAGALLEQGEAQNALQIAEKALLYNPQDIGSLLNKGSALLDLENYQAALVCFDQVIRLAPNYASAFGNQALALEALDRLEAAVESFDRAIGLNPGVAKYHLKRANVLNELGWNEAALLGYDNALRLDPANTEIFSNRGLVYQAMGRIDEALADYDHSISLNPEFADAQWKKGLLELLTGNYCDGWQRYERRWNVDYLRNVQPRAYPQPLWLGDELLAGKRLLIWPEQGLGDYLQCVRYAGLAIEQGAQVILEAPASLVPLLETLPWPVTLIESGQAPPLFDYHTPVMSLPLAFKTELASIPAAIPYLRVEEGKRRDWQQRLGDQTRPRIGLVWSGSTGHKKDIYRSTNLATLLPLLELPFDFHCLQKEIRSADEEMLKRHPQVQVHCDVLEDFSDTAALAQAMDVVITVDTSVAHLAGAMGKAVWILLPFAPDYRWLLDREDTPWYPTARLFRQKMLGDWGPVVENIKACLAENLAKLG